MSVSNEDPGGTLVEVVKNRIAACICMGLMALLRYNTREFLSRPTAAVRLACAERLVRMVQHHKIVGLQASHSSL